jgi:hypothetical protein
MTRRLILLVATLLVSTQLAFAKFDQKDRAYLDQEFRNLRDQITALKTQADQLAALIAELRQNQTQAQVVMIRQQRLMQEIEQTVSSLRLGHEENVAALRTALSELQSEQRKAFAALAGRSLEASEPSAVATPYTPVTARGATPRVPQGYVTVVQGDDITVDLGSAQGVQPGTRLAVYKAADPATRVGVLEVIQVVDAGNSRARILTMNAGTRPEFSDIVRLE